MHQETQLAIFVAHYGSSDEAISFLLPQLESVLKTGQEDVHWVDPLNPEKVSTTIPASDQRKEGVVMSLGSIALHLKDDSAESKIGGAGRGRNSPRGIPPPPTTSMRPRIRTTSSRRRRHCSGSSPSTTRCCRGPSPKPTPSSNWRDRVTCDGR